LQKHDIDYDETYSPIIDAITFRYLINQTTYERTNICLMDVFTTYLYGSIDNDVYMKILKGFKMHEAYNLNS
jgi:hypothetical protein